MLQGTADGTFLVRFSENSVGFYALAVRFGGKVLHWRICPLPNGDGFHVNTEEQFSEIKSIIEHFHSNHLPQTTAILMFAFAN
jgi:hypothetical protein